MTDYYRVSYSLFNLDDKTDCFFMICNGNGMSNAGIYDKDLLLFKYTDKPHLMAHHLYVCPQDSAELRRHLAFRDLLRSDPEAAARYSRVKERAAALYPDDIDGYISYKSFCIAELYARCGVHPSK